MTDVHTYFYIVVDTQRGCRTLKMKWYFTADTVFLTFCPFHQNSDLKTVTFCCRVLY